jgi:hypothetical protein
VKCQNRYPLLGNDTVNMLLRHQRNEPLLGKKYTRDGGGTVEGGVFCTVHAEAI